MNRVIRQAQELQAKMAKAQQVPHRVSHMLQHMEHGYNIKRRVLKLCLFEQATLHRRAQQPAGKGGIGRHRLDADYKHGVHFTALPTAWV